MGLPGVGIFLARIFWGSLKEVAAGKQKGNCGMAKPAAPGGFQAGSAAGFGFGTLSGCAVCAPGSPGWIWREQGRDGVRSQEPLGRGACSGDGAGPAVMQLLSVLQEGAVLPLLPSWNSSGALSLGVLCSMSVFLKGREWQQWEPSLCESQPGLELWPRQASIPCQHSHLARTILVFFRAASGTLPAAPAKARGASRSSGACAEQAAAFQGSGYSGWKTLPARTKAPGIACSSGEVSVLWLSCSRDVFEFISCCRVCLEEESGRFSHLRSVFI